MRARVVLALLAMPLLPACTTGLLYKHTLEPLTTNFHKTPSAIVGSDEKSGDVKHLHVPYFNLDVMSDSNAIGDIARREGFEEVYYADFETLSILSIWNQYTVHVYGKLAEK
jgi:hypothetical protein